MLKTEMAPCFAMLLLLIPTPTVADVTSDLARCELEAERLYPAPHNKGAQNWRRQSTETGREYRTVHAGGRLYRGLASVSTDFMLNLIAYNLIRIPKLLTA
jgi:hypothetical protein